MPDLNDAVETKADAAQELASDLAEAIDERGWTVGTAESLTGGTIATLLAAAPRAGEWFRGSVVAYSPDVKFDLLGVDPGPVVTEDCARTMARSASRLLEADLVVSVTGVGGPEPDEGEPAGTAWFAVVTPDAEHAEEARFDGDPPEVVTASTEHALRLLIEAARG